MVMVVAIAVIVIAAIVLWSLVRFFLRSPQLFSLAMRERKRRKGFDAISRGLIAIGAGDARAAQRYAALADKSAAGESLALLLRAQTAQMNGDRVGAEAGVPRHGGARGHAAARLARAVRGGAAPPTIRSPHVLPQRKPRGLRPRSPGPGRRCSNSAARRATGTARSRVLESQRRKAACSIARSTGGSAACC